MTQADPKLPQVLRPLNPGSFQRPKTKLPAPKPKVNPRKLEHGFRMISAGIPFVLSGFYYKSNPMPKLWPQDENDRLAHYPAQSLGELPALGYP